MSQKLDITLDDTRQLQMVAKALSSEARIDILRLLKNRSRNVNELSAELGMPPSSAAAHIRVLEDAGLIKTTYQPGIRGSMKLCEIAKNEIHIDLLSKFSAYEEMKVYDMPIGNYVDYKAKPTCGIVSEKGPIELEDEPSCFFNPDRNSAKLIWLADGYVEYRFPGNELKDKKVRRIEISAELCSEDHEYNMDYPSDLSLWVNGSKVGTWECPGDFGGRRGKLNPSWWPDKNTQYGKLKTWTITDTASFLDHDKISEVNLQDLKLHEQEYIAVRLGIDETAAHKGGMNLFGDCFGDYAQNIIMRLIF